MKLMFQSFVLDVLHFLVAGMYQHKINLLSYGCVCTVFGVMTNVLKIVLCIALPTYSTYALQRG